MKFELDKTNREELKALGLINENDKINLSKENKELLEQGLKSEDLKLDNIMIQNNIVSLDAKISLYKIEDETRIRVHPYFKDIEQNQLLTAEEMKKLKESTDIEKIHNSVSGTIKDYGKAPYEFKEDEKENFYIKLEKDGEETIIWGVDLATRIDESKKKRGDDVTIEKLGMQEVKVQDKKGNWITANRNTFSISDDINKNDFSLAKYNPETKSFDIIDPKQLNVDAINGKRLTEEQKKKLRNGEEIQEDGTTLQIDPTKKKGFITNKNLVILSLLLDGGTSYLFIKTAKMLEKIHTERKENIKEKDRVNKEQLKDIEKLYKEIEDKAKKASNKEDFNPVLDKLSKEYTKTYNSINYKDPTISKTVEEAVSIENKQEEKKEQGHEEELELTEKTGKSRGR